MRNNLKNTIKNNVATLCYAIIIFGLSVASTRASMSDYTATPPFLASDSVDPNLLLLIDNSASMYDLAYVSATEEYCYDASYNTSQTYAGYFSSSTWYGYNLGTYKFEAKSDADATTLCNAASYKKSGHTCIKFDAGGAVTAFTATGNFLNWATASKLDVEKKILTGGKFDSANSRLVMESRGCLGRRFIKKVDVLSGGTTYYLTLGIRPPTSSEKADASDLTTRIEIYPVTSTGFNHSDCQAAIDGLQAASPNQGQIKQDIEECMSYGSGNALLANSMSAFNHAVHNCWYRAKHGTWPPGAGPTQSIKNDCQGVYTEMHKANASLGPDDISSSDRGYVCFGEYHANPEEREGYVGRCWNESSATWRANGNLNTAGWIADSDACIEQATRDFCDYMDVPDVIDPSDQAGETSNFWNLPAMLVDSGVVGQLGNAKLVMKGYLAQSSAPTGLIHNYSSDLRMGAMIFNTDGSASECASNTNMSCPGTNSDGGRIISSIDQSDAHTTSLVTAINSVVADTWTPITEAMYNAIGYYTQNSGMRINSADFSTATDPVTAWCQFNNILIVTDGASTADRHASVISFAQTSGQNDGDANDINPCGSLSGSSYLDDLTYYAKHNGADIYPTGNKQMDGENKQPITTYIVAAGVRSTGTDECSPDVLLTRAAENSGTSLFAATDLSNLEEQLTDAFEAIIGNSASGTAASVVSATHRGEGAVYQAVFYPTYRDADGTEITWIGQLHGLLIDQWGNMREDTNGNGALDKTTDTLVDVYYDETEGRTRARRYADTNGDGVADGAATVIELANIDYLWEAGKILAERTASTRDIYTWVDTDGDGVVDGGTSVDSGEFISFTASAATTLRPYLNVDASGSTTNTTNLINFIRGTDQTGYRSRTVNVEGTDRVWKLGDIIHSTPTVVGRPEENYDIIYSDTSYRTFKTTYNGRRNVVYVGGNDGMLHAFNAGFYNESDSAFSTGSSTPTYSSALPALGEELWAYIPYNLLPHLQWLKSTAYSHVYYVDLKPKVIDAKIFSADSTHPGGWGTLLVCGMRFGGGTINVTDDFDYNAGTANTTKTFRSAYFALDITNPDFPPKLLWEFSDANLGFTTSYPTIANVNFASTAWAIAFGSGPTTYSGTSAQTPRTYVANLATGANITGSPVTTGSANGFMGDPMTVDLNITATQCSSGNCTYSPDVLYIGNSLGQLWRIRSISNSSAGTAATLLDLGTTRPITGAPSASVDEDDRLWIYLGTGRFYSVSDKSNTSSQCLVGVKEPCDLADSDGDSNDTELTYATVLTSNLLNVTNYKVYEGGYVDDDPAHNPAISTFDGLVEQIEQTASESSPRKYDGWIRDITDGERCNSKPTVLGGIVSISTFDPGSNVSSCGVGGDAYLYGLHYKTGTAYSKSVLGTGSDTLTVDNQAHHEILNVVSLGRGVSATPSLHVGTQQGAKAFVQTSTGQIAVIDQENLAESFKSRPLHWIQPGD